MSDFLTEEELAEIEALSQEDEGIESPPKEDLSVPNEEPELEPQTEPEKVEEAPKVEEKKRPIKLSNSGKTFSDNKRDQDDPVSFSKKLREDVAFNEHNLNESFMNQAAHVAYYSVIAHRSAEAHEKAKAKLDLVEAMIDNELRNEAIDKGEKVTEALLAKKIKLDTRYQAAQYAVIEARTKAGITKDAMEAFRHKRDMLIQVGADQREEMKGELRMKAVS